MVYVLPSCRSSVSPMRRRPVRAPSIAQTKGFRTSEQTPFDIEMRFTIAIDCIAVEDEYGNTPAQRAELDWLLYNKPLEYAQMVLRGEMERYLSLGCDHGRLED